MTNLNTDSAGERVQSFLGDQTQQGRTYVPGNETKGSGVKRAKKAIQGVDEQFPKASSAQGQAQGGQSADLNGVGQQFQGYGYH